MMKKSVAAVFLIIALFFGVIPVLPQGSGLITFAQEYTFKDDVPSDWAKAIVARFISEGRIPENLQKNFKRPITVGEYAELNYNFTYETWSEELFNKIKVADSSIKDTAPNYVKKAFITGLIKNSNELSKTMTREEAASMLIMANTNLSNIAYCLKVDDYNSISPDRLDEVAAVVDRGYIPVINNKFSPKIPFTVEQAIVGMENLRIDYILGIIPLGELRDASSVTVESNRVTLNFSEKRYAEDYIYTYVSPRLDDLEITGAPQRFDVGYMIIELNGSGFDVRYTLKNNLCNVKNFDYCDEQPTFGIDNYKSEPRELKASEKINLTIQPDTIHKKLYVRLDPIIKNIIKPGMNTTEKYKAIHDYVTKYITYSGNLDYFTAESALKALDTKKGVCANYASLFYFLSRRAAVPVRIIEGDSTAGRHMWNLVYVNNQWLHLDTTWDDPKNKTIYDFYMKPMEHMMKTHKWNGFAYPDPDAYPKIDGMKIKTTMEFRIYVLQQFGKGSTPPTIKFKLLNENIDKDYRFLRFYAIFGRYNLTYDAKSGIYTLKYKSL